ncbi:MAG: GNAT family N-acetyltransferase [Alphaproteobacteria bacterium]|nr:GNAT family N-acetyltransferase [Alphaproteobacteria bacterium]
MSNQTRIKSLDSVSSVERVEKLSIADLNDLCDATKSSIKDGGGFGWIKSPSHDVLERFWNGVLIMPARILLVARLDNVICGTCQLWKPPQNNEAQKHAVQLTTNFIAPWARGYGLAEMLIEKAEKVALQEGFKVINLDVRETMESAISLYESMEYTRIGMHPYYACVDNKILKGYYYYKIIDKKSIEQKS